MSTTTVEESGGVTAPPAREAEREDDARLVEAARAGDDSAFGALYDRWFDRVYDLCRRIVHDPEVARETAQDAFLAAWRGLGGLREPASFGGWLLRIARNQSLNRWEHERRTSPVEDMTTVLAVAPTTGPAGFTAEDRAVTVTDPAEIAADAELVALIEDAAAALGERDASVLDLHLRHGLDPQELAEELGVSHSAAKQVVHRLRGRLGDAIKARVLWRAGAPACSELRAQLEAKELVTFDADAARVIKRHAGACAECAQRQESRLSPAALFGAVPIGIAPVLLKQQTALAMESAGVPMGGSQGAGAGAGGAGARLARRLGRVGAPGGIVAVVVVTAVVLAAATVGEPKGTVTAGPEPATPISGPTVVDDVAASGPATESTVPVSVPGTPTPKPTTSPGAGQLPAGPAAAPVPAPPPPAAPPAIVSFGMAPTTAATTFTMPGPVLSWSVSAGAGTVAVSGPGISSGAFSGSQAVCPGTVTGGRCASAMGVYSYTLAVFDQGGAVVDQRTVTLSIR
ncbi:MAG: RNA polymerase sigma factor [Actinomycetota bacterium]